MNTRISVEIKVRIWKGDDTEDGKPDRACDLTASASVGRCYGSQSKIEIAEKTRAIISDISTVIAEKLEQNTDANRN